MNENKTNINWARWIYGKPDKSIEKTYFLI